MKHLSPLLSVFFSFIYSCCIRKDYFSSDQLPSKNTGDHICNCISQSRYNAPAQDWPCYHGYHKCCFNYISLAAFQQCQNEGNPQYQATAAPTVIQSISMQTQKENKGRNAFKWPVLNHRRHYIFFAELTAVAQTGSTLRYFMVLEKFLWSHPTNFNLMMYMRWKCKRKKSPGHNPLSTWSPFTCSACS